MMLTMRSLALVLEGSSRSIPEEESMPRLESLKLEGRGAEQMERCALYRNDKLKVKRQ